MTLNCDVQNGSSHVRLVELIMLSREGHARTESKGIPIQILVKELRHRRILSASSGRVVVIMSLDVLGRSVGAGRGEDLRASVIEVGRIWPRSRSLDLGIVNHIGLGIVFLLY